MKGALSSSVTPASCVVHFDAKEWDRSGGGSLLTIYMSWFNEPVSEPDIVKKDFFRFCTGPWSVVSDPPATP